MKRAREDDEWQRAEGRRQHLHVAAPAGADHANRVGLPKDGGDVASDLLRHLALEEVLAVGVERAQCRDVLGEEGQLLS